MTELAISRTPEVIAAEINVIKAQTREVVCKSAIEIGRRLVEAKRCVPHGSWGAWLEENVEYSERTAQDLMKMFEEYGYKMVRACAVDQFPGTYHTAPHPSPEHASAAPPR